MMIKKIIIICIVGLIVAGVLNLVFSPIHLNEKFFKIDNYNIIYSNPKNKIASKKNTIVIKIPENGSAENYISKLRESKSSFWSHVRKKESGYGCFSNSFFNTIEPYFTDTEQNELELLDNINYWSHKSVNSKHYLTLGIIYNENYIFIQSITALFIQQ